MLYWLLSAITPPHTHNHTPTHPLVPNTLRPPPPKHTPPPPRNAQAALSSGLVLGARCFVVAALTLSYLASILLSIVDAVYIVSVTWV
jgi:hypothetical protein